MTGAQAVRAWDGSFFAYTVIHNRVWYTPWDRNTDVVWESPARLALALTNDVGVTLWAFCVGFALVPLVAVLLCWIVASERPDLFAWGVLGICVACLPGQWFVVGEGPIAIQLGWPLLIAAAAGLEGRRAVVAVLLLPAIFWQHPFSAAIFVGAAALVLLAPRLPGALASPGRFVWATIFLALAAYRVTLIHSNEGAGTGTPALVGNSTSGFIKPALVFVLLAAAAMVLRPRDRRARLAAPALLAFAGVILAAQASSASFWGAALDYRASVLLVTAPVGALMVLDLSRAQRPLAIDRGRVAMTAAAVFAVVLAVQARSWRGELDVLAEGVAAGPECRSIHDVSPWWRHGPLDHWATPYNAILEQGTDVDRLVLPTHKSCARFAHTGEVHLGDFGPDVEPPGEYDLPKPAAGSKRAAPHRRLPAAMRQ